MTLGSLAASWCLLFAGVAAPRLAAQPAAPSSTMAATTAATAFVEWARARNVPLDAAGQAFRALDGELAEARLIGVGESVHEVQQFVVFRSQLLQDLVRRHRVTALVLESGLPEAMALDDYVRGRASAVDFEAGLPNGYGSLEEMRRILEWLREWNLGPGREHPVAVYGADLPARAGSMVPALDRLQELTAASPAIKPMIDAIRPLAVQIAHTWWRGAAEKYAEMPADAKAALTSGVDALSEAAGRLSEGDPERLAWARRVALVARQHETTLRLGMFAASAPRDQALADNTLWALGRVPAGERAVFWAHNAHVQLVRAQGPPPVRPGSHLLAGMRLREALGKAYYAIGTAYGGPALDDGAVAAIDSVDGALETVANRAFLLPLRDRARSPAVESWLAQERWMRYQVKSLTVPLGAAFDALAYFDRAERAGRVTVPR